MKKKGTYKTPIRGLYKIIENKKVKMKRKILEWKWKIKPKMSTIEQRQLCVVLNC